MTDMALKDSLLRRNSVNPEGLANGIAKLNSSLHNKTNGGVVGAIPASPKMSLPRVTRRGPRGGKGGDDEEDVVTLMKRDMSYNAIARRADHYNNNSSDSESPDGSSHGTNTDKDDPMGASHRSASLINNESTNQELEQIQTAEQEETSAIEIRRIVQFLLLGVLAILTIVAMAAVGVAMRDEQERSDQQNTQTSDNAFHSLGNAVRMQQRTLHQSLQSFANVMAHQTVISSENASWPFVTNPLFEIQGQPIREMLPQIDLLAFSPLISSTQQKESEWNEYAWTHQTWIRDAWNFLGYTVEPGNVAPSIYQSSTATSTTQSNFLAPLWQTSPPPSEAYKINYNVLSHDAIAELYQDVTTLLPLSQAAISPVLDDLPYLYGLELVEEEDQNPRSVLLIPIRDRQGGVQEAGEVVGFLQVLINWQDYITQILPGATTNGRARLRNTCGQNYTFLIQPGNSSSSASGVSVVDNDTVDDDYTDAVVVEDILSLPGTGNGSCSYSLEFANEPLESQQQQQDNNMEGILIIAMVPLALAFVVLLAMGICMTQLNDWVEKRHNKLGVSAAKSNAIVASMFPTKIRDRLLADANTMGGGGDLASSTTSASGGENKRSISSIGSKRAVKKLLSNSRKRGSSSLDDIGESLKDNHASDSAAIMSAADEELGAGGGADESQECYPMFKGGSERLKNYLDNGLTPDEAQYSAPIADLFPNCTVLFADIAGFTAWSSVREPSQVFTLLETLYQSFDDIAKKRNVFKVETVGDCYVAVTGLPEPQDDHALIMVRFARDCMYKSYELTKKLEVNLGPDTAELSMRFGLHSGPVTAGVLRGDRSRFQLFGDTVNTASRMESTGQKGRIQMSEETADILIQMRKSHLVRQREDKVTAKGKGEMTTFWMALGSDPDEVEEEEVVPPPTMLGRNVSSGVDSIIECDEDDTSVESVEMEKEEGDKGGLIRKKPNRRGVNNNNSGSSSNSGSNRGGPRGAPKRRKPPAISMSGFGSFKSPREKKQNKESRLVDWNVEVLSKLLKHVIARRNALGLSAPDDEVKLERPDGQTVLEEVREIITLPKFDASAAKKQEDPEKMELDPLIKEQLHDYVSTLASYYRDNPFHNYEHASHVTMSVVKLLSRIVAPKAVDRTKMTSAEKMSAELHDHTYGITSDPLTQFAVVLSALIHDVDHTGVPNSQLVKENAKVAAYYKNKSVAEQNSVDQSWDLLMESQFKELRRAIYCDESELTRFRSLLVNSVMATDIVDKELKQLRNNRWDKAFSGEVPQTEKEVHDAVNRKATIVLEHLIQASDVSHTMQHWHVYRKWNERLFHEMFNAYCAGRAEKDPSEFWYKGEIGFFDFYIIPLAKKLKDCGVFGVSSDEYLNYAIKNREEWARKGEAVTAEMVAKARDKDLARLERQASVRGPVIAEMKAAVRSMRTPQKKQDQFRQASFRHLRTEAQETESIAMPHHGFRRQPPPRRGTPTRGTVASLSMGNIERSALKEFRNQKPSVPIRKLSARGMGMGMRKPERRNSNHDLGS
ncbi:Receptor-type guanylate cyclase gcy [Seminavis robusta]|uniref:Receptor-type guanylate cyclase gcy n=1 Tax=Seminavis robusta TaxID=568900 RepID=A0A9N8HQQ4_9STRA|nr:Receptor-type guanylate cyclase gcy [Seminavis robusta]|eukprot:Sro1008_g230500.1 Receptor-type guanylate cyclase gcy (1521) ;mRNA; r:2866-9123